MSIVRRLGALPRARGLLGLALPFVPGGPGRSPAHHTAGLCAWRRGDRPGRIRPVRAGDRQGR